MNEWINAPVDNAAASRVRARVIQRIQRRRWAKRGAIAALLISLLAWPRMPEAETLALSMPPAPIAPAVQLAPKPVLVARAAPSAKPAEKIVLYTNDPDVVIVLVSEGGSE